jgi:hypothetical protein
MIVAVTQQKSYLLSRNTYRKTMVVRVRTKLQKAAQSHIPDKNKDEKPMCGLLRMVGGKVVMSEQQSSC